MATKSITQLHRIFIARKDAEGETWKSVVFGPTDLGQDTQATVNIAPRKASRASSKGTTTKPVAGTIDEFSGSITILADYWSALGRALGIWKDAGYDKKSSEAGNMTDESKELCGDDRPAMVVIQGVCDNGSTGDVMLSRCYPSIDDDIEIGAGDTQEITIALNPQMYDEATMSEDGYPKCSYRFGDASLTEEQRFDALTSKYTKVGGE